MAAMLSSLIFRLTICISYVFHFYYHVYSFVDFNNKCIKKTLSGIIISYIKYIANIILGIIIDDELKMDQSYYLYQK